ncbi:MAG: 50S ribosomal protein L21 [Phenylobacterium sp.]|nr:MAG: 50S ribosomal protein L21 [Phenylobacterium sp.]
MYAVIKTGGKQYRVQPGDLLVVEKLDGEPGAKVAFGDVLMLGEGEAVTVGAPLVEGASVSATLIETRKGEKVKIFKKIRRQGYRRTRGHRQFQSVLRVTAIAGAGQEAKWDGEVSLTTKAELDARARGLAFVAPGAVEAKADAKTAKAAPAKQTRAAPKAKTAEEVVASPEVKDAMAAAETNAPVAEAPAKKAPAKTAAPKKAAAPKAEAKAKPAAKKAAAPKAEAKAVTEKKPAAKKAPAAKKKD